MTNPFNSRTYSTIRNDLIHLQTEIMSEGDQVRGVKHIASFVGQFFPRVLTANTVEECLDQLNVIFEDANPFKNELTAKEASTMVHDLKYLPYIKADMQEYLIDKISSHLITSKDSPEKSEVADALGQAKKKRSPRSKAPQQPSLFQEDAQREQFLNDVEEKAESSTLSNPEVQKIIEKGEDLGIPAQDVSKTIQNAKTKKLNQPKAKNPEKQEESAPVKQPESKKEDIPSSQAELVKEVSGDQAQTKAEQPPQQLDPKTVRRLAREFIEGFKLELSDPRFIATRDWQKSKIEEADKLGIDKDELGDVYKEVIKAKQQKKKEEQDKSEKQTQDKVQSALQQLKDYVKQNQSITERKQLFDLINQLLETGEERKLIIGLVRSDKELSDLLAANAQPPEGKEEEAQAEENTKDEEAQAADQKDTEDLLQRLQQHMDQSKEQPKEEAKAEEKPKEEAQAEEAERIGYPGLTNKQSFLKSIEDSDWSKLDKLSKVIAKEGSDSITIPEEVGSSKVSVSTVSNQVFLTIADSNRPEQTAYQFCKNENLISAISSREFLIELKRGLLQSKSLDNFIGYSDKLARRHSIFKEDDNFKKIMSFLYSSKFKTSDPEQVERFLVDKVLKKKYRKSFDTLLSIARDKFTSSKARWDNLSEATSDKELENI